jgi:hypothetical protein
MSPDGPVGIKKSCHRRAPSNRRHSAPRWESGSTRQGRIIHGIGRSEKRTRGGPGRRRSAALREACSGEPEQGSSGRKLGQPAPTPALLRGHCGGFRCTTELAEPELGSPTRSSSSRAGTGKRQPRSRHQPCVHTASRHRPRQGKGRTPVGHEVARRRGRETQRLSRRSLQPRIEGAWPVRFWIRRRRRSAPRAGQVYLPQGQRTRSHQGHSRDTRFQDSARTGSRGSSRHDDSKQRKGLILLRPRPRARRSHRGRAANGFCRAWIEWSSGRGRARETAVLEFSSISS